VANGPESQSYGYPTEDPDGKTRVHGTLEEPKEFVDPTPTTPIPVQSEEGDKEYVDDTPTGEIPVQEAPPREEAPDEESTESSTEEKKMGPRLRRGVFIFSLVALTGSLVGTSLLLDKNFTGWVFATLASVFTGVFIWQALYPPKKLRKPRQMLAVSLALLFFILPMTTIVGRTTNLSTEEQQQAASAQRVAVESSFTEQIDFIPGCEFISNYNLEELKAADVIKLDGPQCTIRINLTKASVVATPLPKSLLDRKNTKLDQDGNWLQIAVKSENGGTIFLYRPETAATRGAQPIPQYQAGTPNFEYWPMKEAK
jgi:energy-coupling factor transporter transmembrane protein EcfT